MFLLNRQAMLDEKFKDKNLQYKMFLLNLGGFSQKFLTQVFTIQNVSIKFPFPFTK